jgi:hypothetical protein
MRFLSDTVVIHAGENAEWTNQDPITPHTITFGIEPANPMPPSANVTIDADGALHADHFGLQQCAFRVYHRGSARPHGTFARCTMI